MKGIICKKDEGLVYDNIVWYSHTRGYHKSKGRSIHRYIWEKYNGSIPKGHVIHHIDHDKNNNILSNLRLMSRQDHNIYHLSIANKAKIGKHRSYETRQKLSKAFKGRVSHFKGSTHTQKAKEKNRKAHNKRLLCISTGVEYESTKEAARLTNGSQTGISAACIGRLLTSGNCQWRYV